MYQSEDLQNGTLQRNSGREGTLNRNSSRDDATQARLNRLQNRSNGIHTKTGRRFSANTSSRSSDPSRGRSSEDNAIGRRSLFKDRTSGRGRYNRDKRDARRSKR